MYMYMYVCMYVGRYECLHIHKDRYKYMYVVICI